MKTSGMPFSASTSGKYAPLTQAELAETLCGFKFKRKSSPMAQIADLYLYPICRGSYEDSYRPYVTLVENRKLVNSVLDPALLEVCGIKLSCFELVNRGPKTQKPDESPAFAQPSQRGPHGTMPAFKIGDSLGNFNDF